MSRGQPFSRSMKGRPTSIEATRVWSRVCVDVHTSRTTLATSHSVARPAKARTSSGLFSGHGLCSGEKSYMRPSISANSLRSATIGLARTAWGQRVAVAPASRRQRSLSAYEPYSPSCRLVPAPGWYAGRAPVASPGSTP